MRERPRLLEIAGLAGVGKSTLTRMLCRHHRQIAQGEDFDTATLRQHLRYADYSLSNLFPLLPLLFRLGRTGFTLTREDVKKMLYLRGWHKVFERQREFSDRTIAVDQGPVFYLATLYGFGPEALRTRECCEWWDRMSAHWSAQLDAIVWLDTPEQVLMDRINKRATFHVIKEKPFSTTHVFLERYRSAYAYTISALTSRRSIEIVKFDTSCNTTQSIVSQLGARWHF